ncbi:hypothetical protein P3H15_22810 [Rhodococcus sp. T2V]|uniref:hypothetical protein n=1 Tax=Rhodococcus sp. T2V TaxID=3034164 RepID=UPI0023E17827|nr:hypothetical protein [Rhodococcus sp. T2V]MDF3307858.1 hypothetical protein [Rhodococcus sp. T2V]
MGFLGDLARGHDRREDKRFRKMRERSAHEEIDRAERKAAEYKELMEDAKRNGAQELYEKFKREMEDAQILADDIWIMQLEGRF